MSRTTLYLVRHGETEYNRRRIMQGRRINSSLNDTGLQQAEALGERLAGLAIDAVYTSSLRRAIETGAAIAARHPGASVYRREELDEMSWGVFEGQTVTEEVEAGLARMHARWDEGDYDCRIEEGESIREVQRRGARVLDEIVAQHAGETVVIVTHGRFLRVLLATLLDEYGLARMGEIAHTNTGVNHLVVENGRYVAERLNCTDHLPNDGLPTDAHQLESVE